ncbi:response regulator transcription factor [Pseudonocardia sp. KRD-184]|uniref:Response regulator transcription factor n=1 Tax=Pseudonocardia oceani TaxID=2792013 RepID=A0ABS6UFD2_9PSEU|nr:response regulator transcription factor [Pseudonocardia oceani]MBW0092234.1 response regulator transcription factor [Pseudonocardia oceani]MBW0099225.1 response regulator transcription factor [Pseudonocardia oceani]MBW0111743.1 response regulator transcription factor [Pseudonocardia oceani]MBW0121669.1 response regulator transcription factor [Pseudonocardia oceani]MBW0130631.1 response regulator transcription factor [Pseudonocardia oceani]
MRVVIGEDEALLREGLVLLLGRAGFDVVAAEDDAERLEAAALRHRPDVVVTDIRMPPGRTDDGLRAALRLRSRLPRTGILVLSQHLSRQYAIDLLAGDASGVGYLLKQRIADAGRFAADIRRVAGGATVLDPEIAATALARAEQVDDRVPRLTRRQREVLSLLAQGLNNAAIAESLVITEKSVVEHVSKIYDALQLPQTGHQHRRVLAVLRYLSR